MSKFIFLVILLFVNINIFAQNNNELNTVYIKLGDQILTELNKLKFPSKTLLISVNTQMSAGCGLDHSDYSVANENNNLRYKKFWNNVNFKKFTKNFSDKILIPVQDIIGNGFEQIDCNILYKFVDYKNIPQKKINNICVFSYSNNFHEEIQMLTDSDFFASEKNNDKLIIRIENKNFFLKYI